MSIRAGIRLILLVLLCPGTVAFAENIDPDNDGSQYAFAENAGWINGEPNSDGGPGMQVNDFDVRGFLWGENIGWISLSGLNTNSAPPREYGVTNDGSGVLSGFAWGENVGWVSLSCANTDSCGRVGYGVKIDPSTGDFRGRAWSENEGWITFASEGPNPYKMKTSWTCDPPPPPPPGTPRLSLDKSGVNTVLTWSAVPPHPGFDVVGGSLDDLRSSGGDFAVATERCLADNQVGTTLVLPGISADPGNQWFLVRGVNCGASGTYDSGGASQAGPRDAEIAASGNDCP